MPTNALILSGGGARAAYQVGVLSAINDLLPRTTHNPFPVICGTSAGAMNALALATHSGHFFEAVDDLKSIWSDLRTDRVFRSHWWDLLMGMSRVGRSLFNGGVGHKNSISLLDNSPLREFLAQHIHFDQLQQGFDTGDLKAVCVSAMNYSTSESVSFFQDGGEVDDWRRYRRLGVSTALTVDHLLASSAIPGIFPATKLGSSYYGDGALRQVSPISPALHLGADRVMVIGVSGNRNPQHWGKSPIRARHSPSIAQVGGHLFSSAFIDGLEGDLEHLERVNTLLEAIPPETLEEQGMGHLRPVETLVISPSQQLDKIAGRKIRYLPKSVRWFLRATGGTAQGGGAAISSYILFEPEFCDELIELGYADAMWEKERIQAFFS